MATHVTRRAFAVDCPAAPRHGMSERPMHQVAVMYDQARFVPFPTAV